MSTTVIGTVKIKSQCTDLVKENSDRIFVLFSASLCEKGVQDRDCGDGYTYFDVRSAVPQAPDRTISSDFINRLQSYVDDVCAEGCGGGGGGREAAGGEDSSYDSDCEAEPPAPRHHQDVSRTASDTLAAEYAEYVQSTDVSPGYTARVEFALKLGYTERLVQAALQKLGPSPAQNELLAELIKLGAQRGGSCDSSPSESTVDVTELPPEPGLGVGHHHLHHQHHQQQQQQLLRPIVIDGSNVAMSHGNKERFSCRGIKICVEWFRARGHREITVFVPKWRKEAPRPDNPVCDQELLAELERDRLLVFTPSRLVGGKRMVCYDDRYILKLAAENDGVVVSNDNYRDLCQESGEFRRVVEERILMYSFVNDRFMPPDDPLGRSGPTLDNFLRLPAKKNSAGSLTTGVSTLDPQQQQQQQAPPPPPCPYGKKCTYGNKCKYGHPERGPLPHKSVTERLSEHAQRHLQAREGGAGEVRKAPLGRTRSSVPPPKESHHAAVAKSRSVDNVGSATGYTTGLVGGGQGGGGGENLHRKLQRQLTLNPASDPRLVRRYVQPLQASQSNPLSPPVHQQQQPSLQSAYVTSAWDLHQHVTRIASAPDSYRPWPPQQPPVHSPQQQHHPQHQAHQQHQQQHQQQQQGRHGGHMQRMSSCSDPQLNVWPHPWAAALHPQEDVRRKLHYHLAAIFPEEQVTQAMQMYPEETNPQKICAAILSMFPKT